MKYLRFLTISMFCIFEATRASFGQVPQNRGPTKILRRLNENACLFQKTIKRAKKIADRIEKSIEGEPSEAMEMLLGILATMRWESETVGSKILS